MLSRQYGRIGDFLFRDVQKIFIIFLIVFIALSIAVTAGIMLIPGDAVESALGTMENTIKSSMNGMELSWGSITMHNIYATLLGICIGFVPFLFLPAISLGINSIVIGLILGYLEITGYSAAEMFVKGILPHGIFELPAIILSCSIGFVICLTFVRAILGRAGVSKVKQVVLDSLRTYILLIVPLLVIAGFIEANITPVLIGI